MAPIDDNRDIDRTKRRIKVRYGLNRPERTAFTMNVSRTGLFINTNNVHAPGTTIQIEIVFPEKSFSLWARVIWAKKVPPQLAQALQCGMGVCFIDPTPEWLEFFAAWQQAHGGPTRT